MAKKTKRQSAPAIDRRPGRTAKARAKLASKPAHAKIVEAFAGTNVYPTDVSMLVGCDLPYAYRLLQRLCATGLARQTGGQRTPYHVYSRRKASGK